MDSTLLMAEDTTRHLRIKKYTVYELIKQSAYFSSKRTPTIIYRQTKRLFPPQAFCGLSVEGIFRREYIRIADRPNRRFRAFIISRQDMCLDLIVNKIVRAGIPVLRSYSCCYKTACMCFANGRVGLQPLVGHVKRRL
jgi:hypothetical protein